MPEIEQKKSEVDEGIAHDIKVYVEHRIQLISITIAEQISAVIAASIQKVIAIMMIFTGMLILWMSLGFYLGSILQSYGTGFLIASLPLILTGILFYRVRFKKIERQIQADLLNKLPFDYSEEPSETDMNLKGD